MQKITVYSTDWRGDCRNAKRFLKSNNISFEEVNLEEDGEATRQVIRWSGGRQVIPTFNIRSESDGEQRVILHNPRMSELAGVLGLDQRSQNEDN